MTDVARLKPHLVLRHGVAMTTSFALARHFEQPHDDVLRAIEALECSAEFRRCNFESAHFVGAADMALPMCYITRDGFSMLAMCFVGRNAAPWATAYLTAFTSFENGRIERLRAQLAYELSDEENLAKIVSMMLTEADAQMLGFVPPKRFKPH